MLKVTKTYRAWVPEAGRQRVFEQLRPLSGSIVSAAIAIPLILVEWSPPWFAVTWLIAHVGHMVLFMMLLMWRPDRWIVEGWAATTAVVMAMLSVSVLVWGRSDDNANWIAATITIAFIAFEVAALPYIGVGRWYYGTVIAGSALVVMAWLTEGPFITVALLVLLASMLAVGQSNFTRQSELDERLAEVEAMVRVDPLTGLLNRRGLEGELRDLEGESLTLAILDADGFKHINDTHGYSAGDASLVALARHLETQLPEWTIARYGGDEFVAFVAGARSLPARLDNPLRVSLGSASGSLQLSMTLGSVTGTAVGTGDRLLSEAGHALRYAKQRGERRRHSEGELHERFVRSYDIVFSSERDSIVPLAQPIVDDSGVRGIELLARWQTEDGELLTPAQFMDTAVEKGLMAEVDMAMLKHGVATIARLGPAHGDPFVAVNLASGGLLRPELPEQLADLLRANNVAPERLMIEITETVSDESSHRWEHAVQAVSDLGVRVAIDDFGAGHSNIQRLGRLAISHLKIDRSLVTGSDQLHEVIRGVTRFCDASGIVVIAEGIETGRQHAALQDLGIDWFQGYLFSQPVPLSDIEEILLSQRTAPVSRSAPG